MEWAQERSGRTEDESGVPEASLHGDTYTSGPSRTQHYGLWAEGKREPRLMGVANGR